jgi:hypothetical protein
MGDVIYFPGETSLDIPADRVLLPAVDADLEQVIVIGRYKDGEFYFAGTTSDVTLTNWLIDKAKKTVMSWA